MSSNGNFLSCDWGTTNFRLRLIERNSLSILREYKSEQGIKGLCQKAKELGQDLTTFFSEFLFNKLEETFKDALDAPLICTGMLSSTLGIKELPYTHLPIKTSGEDLLSETISLQNGKKLLLVSGARTELGFMRGEETQAIGLADSMERDGMLILPGTHSKHLTFMNHEFTQVQNYMTGELFNLMAGQSILASSVNASGWNASYEDVFLAGVKVGSAQGIGSSLLTVRAKHMFDHQSMENGFYYLSGLLIGDELSMLSETTGHIYMAAGDITFPLYKLALESMVSPDRLTLFNNQALRKALFTGHRKILDSNGW